MSIDTGRGQDALTALSAVELAAMVQRGGVSPVQVIQTYLERIERLEPSISAFQVVLQEAALQEAHHLGGRGDLQYLPLAGVPVAVKDNVDVRGVPTRQGSAATSGRPVQKDDELVRRLREAGCVVVGKTRMPELAIWPFTEPRAFGPTHNPWNSAYGVGGSSGGSGAAVAASMAALALGSDGGGSIRVPSACCGIVGLKPGPGIMPLAGGAESHWYGMTEFGPMARTVADAALMLDVLAGQTTYRNPQRPAAPLRLAVSTRPPLMGAKVASEVVAAVEQVATALGQQGHQIVHDNPPYPASLGWRFSRRWLPGIAADADALIAGRESETETRTQSMVKVGRWLRRRGLARPAVDDSLGPRMRQWFSRYDALLLPTLASTAPPLGTWAKGGWMRTTYSVANWLFTTPWNLVRFPAMSVPAGLLAGGLPLAVQLVALPGGESKLLALARQLEEIHPWPQWQG